MTFGVGWGCGSVAQTHRLWVVVNGYHPSIHKVETGELGVQGHPQLHIGFEAILDYIRLCLKKYIFKKIFLKA